MYSNSQNLDTASGQDFWKGSFKSYMKDWITRSKSGESESDKQYVHKDANCENIIRLMKWIRKLTLKVTLCLSKIGQWLAKESSFVVEKWWQQMSSK